MDVQRLTTVTTSRKVYRDGPTRNFDVLEVIPLAMRELFEAVLEEIDRAHVASDLKGGRRAPLVARARIAPPPLRPQLPRQREVSPERAVRHGHRSGVERRGVDRDPVGVRRGLGVGVDVLLLLLSLHTLSPPWLPWWFGGPRDCGRR
jgi:hypothetical protein